MRPPGQMAEPQTSGGSTSAEALIRRAHQLLAACDVPLSPSRVTRLVREYKVKVEPSGMDLTSDRDVKIAEHPLSIPVGCLLHDCCSTVAFCDCLPF